MTSTAKISTTKDCFHIQVRGFFPLFQNTKCTGAENERAGRISAAVTWDETRFSNQNFWQRMEAARAR
jgi:hypothetical protein